MAQEIEGIKIEKEGTLAKCIDEYNVKFTLPALEKQRNKRKNSV